MNDKINHFMQENPGMNLLVKKGSEGASFISNSSTSYMDMEMAKQTGDSIDQPAYKYSDFIGRAELIDTTGTEDCFTAAFVVGQLEGHDVETSLDFANKSAFLCASKQGAG